MYFTSLRLSYAEPHLRYILLFVPVAVAIQNVHTSHNHVLEEYTKGIYNKANTFKL